ncbi:MAG: NAD(P)H-dependent oxidoreductase [Phycisphaerales bacterium]
MAKILAFAGSARRGSANVRLVHAAAHGAREAGAEVTLIDLRDFPMPIFDGDLEAAQGLPESAVRLRSLLAAHQGLLIASPEYNSSISPLLKNVIDWTSRGPNGQGDLSVYRGKVAGLLSASPGAWGGMRGLVTVRSILGNIGVIVLPNQFVLPKAHEAFAEDGSLVDAKHATSARSVAADVARIAASIARG